MQILYHYTSLAGALGILSNKSIWATDVRYLNDPHEFAHALQFAKRFATQIYMEDDYLDEFGRMLRHATESVSAEDLFVTSFSETGDLLSQWRGYCPTSGGVCLGFSYEKILEFCHANGFHFEKCIYEHDRQASQVGALVNECSSKFPMPKISRQSFQSLPTSEQVDAHFSYHESLKEPGNKAQADIALNWLCAEIADLAPRFKNYGYHEEREWRLIARDPDFPKRFRVSSTGSYYVPYVELPLLAGIGIDSLKQIIVGPNPNQQRCINSLRMMASQNGFTDITLTPSEIPYNNW